MPANQRFSVPKLFLIFIMLFSFIAAHAQKDGGGGAIRTDLISPSPTASSISRYGEIPVNNSTGALNFSIPFFNVQGNDLQLPISLNYGYTGLKPAEYAGWVGLGWNLQAGGVITRNVKDLVDSYYGDESFSGPYVQDKLFNGLTNTESADFQTFLNGVYRGKFDTEPDIYNFNFNGYSGKFILYKGKSYCFPNQKLKIMDTGDAFVILTEDGTRYTFNQTETTRAKGNPNAPYTLPNYTSAWYLGTVENAAKTETINLTYNTDAEITQLGPKTQTYKKYDSPSEQSILSDVSNSYPTFVRPLRLIAIESEKYIVMLSAAPSKRLDIPGTNYALGGVSIVDKTSHQALRNFKLNYSYFGTDVSLRLDSVEETGKNASGPERLSKVHRFDYEMDQGFPAKYSLNLDHYGYFNGKDLQTLIPDYIYPGGSNRDVVPNKAKAGALKKITYPTGGSTEITYEGNITYDGNKYVHIPQGETALIVRSSGEADQASGMVSFNIDFGQFVSIDIERYANRTSADGNIRGGSKDYEIFKIVDGDLISPVMHGAIVSEYGPFSFSAYLEAGDYRIVSYIDRYEDQVSATIRHDKTTDIPIEGKLVGGIRIKSIKNQPLIGEPTLKEYKYVNTDGFSTGRNSGDPVYEQSGFTDITIDPDGIHYKPLTSTLYSSYISENYQSGVQSYYASVTENTRSATENLVTRSDYGLADYYNAQPMLTQTIVYKNTSQGLKPLKKATYLNMLVLNDAIVSMRANLTLQADFNGPGAGGGYDGPQRLYSASVTQYNQGWEYVGTKTETNYEDPDSLMVTTAQTYNTFSQNLTLSRMNASDGRQLVSKFKYAEDYTPALNATYIEANVVSPIWEQQSWRVRSPTDSVLVSGSVTEYNSQFKPATVYALQLSNLTGLNNESKTGSAYNYLKSDTRYEPKIGFGYDDLGKLISQQVQYGVPISYQWGYGAAGENKRYPVAEAKNASPSEFFTENFEDAATLAAGNAHTGSKSFAGSYTVNWNRPNGRNYTIAYWYFTGNQWQYKQDAYAANSYALTGGSAYDDISVFPSDAQVSTYTYKWGKLGSSIDPKGQTAYYEYDDFQQLTVVRDQNMNVIRTVDYHYPAQGSTGGGGGEAPPIPDPGTCSGPDKKMINGVCQTGVKAYESSVYNPQTGTYTCTYHYQWTDGSIGDGIYTEINTSSCPIF